MAEDSLKKQMSERKKRMSQDIPRISSGLLCMGFIGLWAYRLHDSPSTYPLQAA